MNGKLVLGMMALSTMVALPCLAHDSWLMPRTPQAQEGKPATVDLTSGMSFPTLESPIKFERIFRGGWRTSDRKGRLDRWDEGDSSLVMHFTPIGAGTAVMYLTLRPKDIDLDADEVAHYFDEIGASEALRDEWQSRGGDATFHETYTKHAKAFMRVGDAGEDPSCLRQVGSAIEFIPQRDPTALTVGDDLVVKVVRGGDDEMEQFAVGLVCGATGDSELRRTNESGMVSFSITSTGWWMVRGTELRKKSDGTFESDFVTMTFYVAGD
jgi:uncharacterized GH25 family protein